jgi:hypothetical protein
LAAENAQELGRSSSARGLEIHLFMTNVEGIELYVLTFAMTEEIHGNCQTKVAWANPGDQACTSSKDQ